MSSNTSMYACPKCGNPNTHVERRPDGFCYCPDCQHRWKIGESQPKPTIFDRITASPEVLAPEFVEMMYDRVAGDYRYYSMLTGDFYNSREKAIAATVAKLKEVADVENR